MSKQKLKFGDRGIWHSPECKENKVKARDIKCTVLDDDGVTLDIFLDEPIKKEWRGIISRVVTIFHSNFTKINLDHCYFCKADRY